MARYFLHIHHGDVLIADPEGVEFVDEAAALVEARSAARDLVINAIQTGRWIDDSRIEVWDERGTTVGMVRLVDVLPIRCRSSH